MHRIRLRGTATSALTAAAVSGREFNVNVIRDRHLLLTHCCGIWTACRWLSNFFDQTASRADDILEVERHSGSVMGFWFRKKRILLRVAQLFYCCSLSFFSSHFLFVIHIPREEVPNGALPPISESTNKCGMIRMITNECITEYSCENLIEFTCLKNYLSMHSPLL